MGKLWGGVLVLGALLVLGPGSGSARAQGMDMDPPHGSDYLTFGEEFRTSGALKFFDQTEDMLRAGKFERAYTRYLFLNANIRGQSLYAGLAADVDQRLQFLRGQMHLEEGALRYEYREPVRRRSRAKPVCPPPAPKTAKAKTPSPEEKPPEMVILPPPPEEKVAPPAKEEAKPAGEQTNPPGEEAKPPAEGTQKPAPAPSPSLLDKLKRRLKFW
jgi:hypothetical protein